MLPFATTSLKLEINHIDALRKKKHWLFDMDGTLTHAIHDFDAIRTQLELPQERPILESIAALPEALAKQKHAELDTLEYDIAAQAQAQEGSIELLQELQARKCQLGIVTRNGHGIAKATLKACQLDGFFTDESIISRDCCEPKPSPAGIQLLLRRWAAEPSLAVMVGDYYFDLAAGRQAGICTVHFDVQGEFAWPAETDYGITSLQTLSALWY